MNITQNNVDKVTAEVNNYLTTGDNNRAMGLPNTANAMYYGALGFLGASLTFNVIDVETYNRLAKIVNAKFIL